MHVCCAFEMKFDCKTDEKKLMCSAYLYRCVTYRIIIYDVEIVSSVYTLGRYCVRPITKLSMRRKLRWSSSVCSSFINIQWIRLGLMCNPCNLLYVRCCFGQNDCTFTLTHSLSDDAFSSQCTFTLYTLALMDCAGDCIDLIMSRFK